MTRRVLSFDLTSKEILNANQERHFAQKAKMIAHLRNLAAVAGLPFHEGKNLELAQARLDYLRADGDWQLMKRRARTRYKKDKSMTEAQVIALVDEEYEQFRPHLMEVSPEPLYPFFNVLVIVQPDTKRRFDPPNLNPTVKALIDGLTDCGWWEDDDFRHMGEMSFRYGGTSGTRGITRMFLVFDELTEQEHTAIQSDFLT